MGDLSASGVIAVLFIVSTVVGWTVYGFLHFTPPAHGKEKPVPKTPWEDRVRMLLNKPEIVWYYKAPDGKMYGGQPRIDFIASDIFGRFIMIEVKSIPDGAKSFSPNLLVPAVQQDALDKIAGTASGVAILAVGHENVLRLYNWGKIRGLTRVSFDSDGAKTPLWQGIWSGPAKWAQHNLHVILAKHWHSEPGPYSGLGPLAGVVSSSEWSKPYPPLTVPESSPLILPPSTQPRRIASTRTDLEIWTKAAQASGSPTVQEMKAEIKRLQDMAPAGVAERVAAEHAASQGAVRPTPPPEKTSGEKRKEILKKANRQHHVRQ